MSLGDLFFLASVLLVVILCCRVLILSLRRRFHAVKRAALLGGAYLAVYAVVLIGVAMARPRRVYPAAERRCFDDWCVAALDVRPAQDVCGEPHGRQWIAHVRVSSVARRVRQRARDARAELEDQQGRRYAPCAAVGRALSDELGPGESFEVALPFRTPEDVMPRGLVVHHGDFPGVVIIGSDQSLLH